MFNLEPNKIVKSLVLYLGLALILYGVWMAATPLIASAWVIIILLIMAIILLFGQRIITRITKPNGKRRRRRKGDNK